MPQEVYSEMEQSLKSGGQYMVSASIKASKFTVKEFDKLCKWIRNRLSDRNESKVGRQSLKALLSHGNQVMEMGVAVPEPEDIGKADPKQEGLNWDKKMIKGFEKYADKFGVNYTILQEKDKNGDKTYHVFFEAKDAVAVSECLKSYLKNDWMKQQNHRSLMDRFRSHQKDVTERTEHEHSREDKIKDKVPHHEER